MIFKWSEDEYLIHFHLHDETLTFFIINFTIKILFLVSKNIYVAKWYNTRYNFRFIIFNLNLEVDSFQMERILAIIENVTPSIM